MDKNAFIKMVFEKAKAAGFSDCELIISSGEEFEVNIFKGEILQYTSASSDGIGFRGLYNGRMGSSSTMVYDEEAADQLVTNALEAAVLIENEDVQFIYGGDEKYPELESYYPALADVPAADKIALAKELEKTALSLDERADRTEGSEVIYSMGSSRIVNTKGLDVSSQVNMAAAFIAPVLTEDGKSSTDFVIESATDFEELKAKKDEMAQRGVKTAADFLHAKSIPSGEYKVLFDNDTFSTILATFSGVFSAENAQKGLSLLKGREGEDIAAQCLTITDDPLRQGSMASRPFDAEGVACFAKNVVENGKFVTLLHNLKTAYKQGVKTTANAGRAGLSGSVRVAPTNFYVQPGTKTREELAADVGEGLLITQLQGMHAGANGVTGDFSLAAKGYVIKDGKIADPAEQFTVAGNFYQLLKDVVEVGCDLKFGMPGGSCFGSPTVRVKGLSIAGQG
ncbi:MAG: TldD/PmbA family protein [Clostridia bacterium]|nr:TldD/PmbA family protein [Clostridia bacterium]